MRINIDSLRRWCHARAQTSKAARLRRKASRAAHRHYLINGIDNAMDVW